MTITVNGLPHDPAPSTVAEAVALVTAEHKGIAVAVNGEVVPRAEWDRPLRSGDGVEILVASQGG